MAPPLFPDGHYLSGSQYFHGSCKWVRRISWCVTENHKITHGWYRNHEPKSVALPVASIIILCIPSTVLLIPHVESFFIAFALAFVTLLTALLGSISLYRLSPFHPLAMYPGPTLCKLTKMWTAWISFGGRAHIYYKTLHDRYGPIVRIGECLDWDLKMSFHGLYFLGPNELSVVNVELIPYIFGPQGLPKGPSKINLLYVNTLFTYLVSFASVGRKTFTNVTEQRRWQFNRHKRSASTCTASQAME